MALDVIGKAVFNYEFGALKEETPLIKAVYRVLRESEHRSAFRFSTGTSRAPRVVPMKQFQEDIAAINDELTELIAVAMRDRDETDLEEFENRDYDGPSTTACCSASWWTCAATRHGRAAARRPHDHAHRGTRDHGCGAHLDHVLARDAPEELRRAQRRVDEIVADPGGAPTVEERSESCRRRGWRWRVHAPVHPRRPS